MNDVITMKITEALGVELNQEFILTNDYHVVYKITKTGLLSAPLISDRDNSYFRKSTISFNVFINSEVLVI